MEAWLAKALEAQALRVSLASDSWLPRDLFWLMGLAGAGPAPPEDVTDKDLLPPAVHTQLCQHSNSMNVDVTEMDLPPPAAHGETDRCIWRETPSRLSLPTCDSLCMLNASVEAADRQHLSHTRPGEGRQADLATICPTHRKICSPM